MKFNEEQLATLSQYEKYFDTAINQRWSSYPGLHAMQVIHHEYCLATGDTRRLNTNCQDCILHLIQDCGMLYFHDRQEVINKKNDATAVALSKAAAKPRKQTIKTKA